MRKVLLIAAATAISLGVAAWWFTGPTVPVRASAEMRGLPTLAPMLRRVMPAVVSITVLARSPTEDNPLYNDSFYRRFFGEQPPAQQRVMAAGSGVIIDAKLGLVLTNNHVVRRAEQIGVALSDGRRIGATLVGADPLTDIAVLKIDATGLTAVALANSDDLQIGDFVVAIGNPFGLGQTATSGIVSALGRSGLGIEGYEDFIQTDAAINPGNSGGALVDIEGRLVGINAAILGPGDGSVGIGFAIPSNMIRQVTEQLTRFGAIKRGSLKMAFDDHPAGMPVAVQAVATSGAMIVIVAPGSTAEKAGIRPGDVVVGIDGKPIATAAQLRARIALMPVGEAVRLDILRDGRRVTLPARIEPASE